MTRQKIWTLDDLVLENRIKLGRGDVISKKDIAAIPGNFPIYSSAQEKNGVFGFYGKYMFDEELITWSVDGGGKLFYRPKHKFSVTNVGGTLRILDPSFLNIRYLYFVLTYLHSNIKFDWVFKAHPSVLRKVYNTIPIPDLNTQLNLVEKLDKAFTEIDSLEKNLQLKEEKSNQLLQSMLSAAFTNTETFDIKLVKLGDVAEVISGQSPEGIFYNKAGEGVPFYQGKKDFGARYIKEPVNWTTQITKIAKADDILMSVRAPVGPINLATQDICIGRGLAAIRVSHKILTEYLFYFLEFIQPSISGTSGAVFDSINKEQISAIQIPLQSIVNQKQIVGKLDKAFAEIDKLKIIISIEKERVSSLRQSILSNAFKFEEKAA